MPRFSAVTRKGRPLSPAKLLEKQITEQVRDFLSYRGWRPVRMQRTVVPGQFQTGEPGIPDFLFLRYFKEPHAAALAIWIEFKAPNGKLREGQPEWHEREIRRGSSVWVVDDFEWFAEEYERVFGWLHSGDAAVGQMDLLVGLR